MATERNQTALHLSCLSSPWLTSRSPQEPRQRDEFLHIWWEVFSCKYKLEVSIKKQATKKPPFVPIYVQIHTSFGCAESTLCLACVPREQLVHFVAFQCVFGRKGPLRALGECQLCQVWLSSLLYLEIIFLPALQPYYTRRLCSLHTIF